MSSKISELPAVVAANLLDADVLPVVSAGVTNKVAITDLRTKILSAATALLDYGGAVFNVKHPLFGAAGNGIADDRDEILAAATAAALVGGILYFPPSSGAFRVSSALSIPANVRVIVDGEISKDVGVVITINGVFEAPIKKVFSGLGTVAFAPGMVAEIYPEWFGAVGDGVADDTTGVFAAISTSASTLSTSTPAGGVIIGSIAPIVFTRKEYFLSATPSVNAYQIFRSRNRSRLRQTAGLDTINFGSAFRCEASGIQFVGGRHAIVYNNNNTDTSRMLIQDCSFQLTTSQAIKVGGYGAVSSSVATLAATVDGFTRSDGGSFITDGFAVGQICYPSGFSNNHISTITAVIAGKVTVSGARTAEGSAAGRGLEATPATDTNSSNVLVRNCEFYRCHSLWQASCDQFTAEDCWVSLDSTATPANTPQIINRCFEMKLEKVFGVTAPSATPAAWRWCDNYNRFYAQDCRFGAENGGIPAVWHRGPLAAGGGDAHGTVVSITGGYATGGAANPTSGLVIFRENIPELLVVKGVRGLGTTGIIIEGPASVYAANITTATYLAAVGAAIYERFRAEVEGNLMASPTAVPAAYKQILLRRYDQILTEPLLQGAVPCGQATAIPLIDVAFDTGANNDDAVALHIDYMVEDGSGPNRNVEAGYVAFAAVRNSAAATVGAVAKHDAAQALSTAVTNGIVFTAVVAANVVTLKVTCTTSNGDNSNIVFRARIVKQPTRANTTVLTSAGVAWDQAGA